MGILVSITHSHSDTDLATVGFVVAGASVASAQDSTVFLSSDGVWIAKQGEAEKIHEDGFAPLAELVTGFVDAGGQVLVCSPCAKKRGIGDADLIPGATIVGGAKVVELMAGGAQTITY